MRNLLYPLFLIGYLLVATGVGAQESEYGLASYYADDFHGSKMYSGEKYNKSDLTAGHKTLPMGTVVRVTRMDNKKYVDVRINDRGPYFKGRIIDLSGKAADALELRKDGTTQVKLDVVGKNGTIPKTSTPKKEKTTPVTSTSRTTPTKKATTSSSTNKTASKSSSSRTTPKASKSKTTSTSTRRPEVYTTKGTATTANGASYKEKLTPDAGFDMVMPKNYTKYGLYKIELQKPKRTGYGVQVASFSNYENVMKQVADLQGKWFNNILLSIEPGANGQTIYKVVLGPFADLSAAKNYKKNAAKKGVKGFVTSLEE